jgi:hypothetical protein
MPIQGVKAFHTRDMCKEKSERRLPLLFEIKVRMKTVNFRFYRRMDFGLTRKVHDFWYVLPLPVFRGRGRRGS